MCYSPAYSWYYSVRVLALRLQMALNRHLQPPRRVQVLGCKTSSLRVWRWRSINRDQTRQRRARARLHTGGISSEIGTHSLSMYSIFGAATPRLSSSLMRHGSTLTYVVYAHIFPANQNWKRRGGISNCPGTSLLCPREYYTLLFLAESARAATGTPYRN